VLAGKVDVRGKIVVVMLSGGNVDAEVFARCLRESAELPAAERST
jgi:hypothetical protein